MRIPDVWFWRLIFVGLLCTNVMFSRDNELNRVAAATVVLSWIGYEFFGRKS